MLDGAVSVVTGASGGIGGATALALAEQGGRIVITGRRVARLAVLRDAIMDRGGQAIMIDGDVASTATAAAIIDAALSEYGRLDILIHSAGYGPPMPLIELPETAWDATIDSCLKGAYAMTRAALPAMLEADAGHIVLVSSIAGKGAEANRVAYCAAKWGIQGFSLALQAELGTTNVQVNVINPASVATNWWTTTEDPQPPSVLERMMAADDVADAIVWLLSRPDRISISELVMHNLHNPWAPR